jgi:hypothetical protein
MTDLNRLRPRPSHLILHRGHGFVISDLAGLIDGGDECSDIASDLCA